MKCDHCLTAAKWEDHKFDKDNKCTVCGYQNKLYTVSFDPGEGIGTMGAMEVVPGTGIPMLGCGFTPPEGHSFHAWDVNGKMYAPKIPFTPTGDTTVKAVYTAELYELWVGGVRVNGDNRGDILGDRTASFYPDTKTLTLDGALITGSAFNAGIYSTLDALTVVVKGQSTVAPHARYGIHAEGALTIRGNALDVKGNTIGIYVPNFDLIIEDADVSTTGAGGSGIYVANVNHAFTVKDSAVTATGVRDPGITANGDIHIEGKGTVLTASGVNAPAMRAVKGYQIGESLGIAQPAGGRIDEDGVYILDADGDRAHWVVIKKATTYPLWIGDVQVTEATAGNLLDSAASYDPDRKTLTFEADPAFGHKAFDYLIRAEGALTIVAPEDGLYLYGRNAKEGVHTGGNLTLKGDVYVNAMNTAIYSGGTIDAEGNVEVRTTNDKGNSANPLIYASGNITVEGSLSGRSQDNGVLCAKKILIKGDVNLSALRGTLISANGNMEIRGDVNTVFNGMMNQTATGLRAGDSLIMNKKAGDRLVGALEREAGEDAGTYTFSRGSLDLAKDYRGNYTLRVIPGILTVGKAAITITADDKFGPAPATIKGLELTWKVSGDLTDAKKVQRELNVELALGDERDTLPVTYPIAVRFTPNGNYTVAVHDGTYTIREDDLRFRGLDKRESYKGYVRAWKRVDGQKIYIGKASPQVHAVSGGYTNHECNTRSVTLNKARLTLKAGRSATLKAKLKGVKPGMNLLDHVPRVRFYSTDANVATVDDGGTVKAIGKGTCTVYAIANNGVRSKVKVTVK